MKNKTLNTETQGNLIKKSKIKIKLNNSPFYVQEKRENINLIFMFVVQIILEVIAIGMSIGLIYDKYAAYGEDLIFILSGLIFGAAIVFGFAALLSVKNKKHITFKLNLASFILLSICMILIMASISRPLFGVIGYSLSFILIPFQIGTLIFVFFHWKRHKGFSKFISLFIFITTVFLSIWYFVTSLVIPLLLIYIKRPSIQTSKQEVIRAVKLKNIDLNDTVNKEHPMTWNAWEKTWPTEPTQSPVSFKIDKNITNLYEWAPKADPIKKGDDLVLFAHGLNGTRYTAMRYMQMFYSNIKAPLSTKGYKMLSFDMRGFGENKNLNRTYALKEGKDIYNAFKKTIEYYNPKHLLIYGISNGAASILSFATKYQTEIRNRATDIKIIEEAGYTSPVEELKAMTEQFWIPHQLTMPQAFPLYRYLTGTYWGERSFINEINLVKQPLMIIHGGNDYIVPSWLGQDLWKKRQEGPYKDITSALFIEDAGHVEIGRKKMFLKEYIKEIQKFVNGKYLKATL